MRSDMSRVVAMEHKATILLFSNGGKEIFKNEDWVVLAPDRAKSTGTDCTF
jgi:hypothetical protein